MEDQRATRDVRAVGVTDRDHPVRREPVNFRRVLDESRQRVSLLGEVVDVEYPLAQPPEEAGHPVLQDPSARAEQGGARRQLAPQPEQVGLVPPGPVEQQKRQRLVRGGGHELVNEPEFGHLRYLAGRLSGGECTCSYFGGHVREPLLSVSFRASSIFAREPSSHFGSTRDVPSFSAGSSTPYPGSCGALSR